MRELQLSDLERYHTGKLATYKAQRHRLIGSDKLGALERVNRQIAWHLAVVELLRSTRARVRAELHAKVCVPEEGWHSR